MESTLTWILILMVLLGTAVVFTYALLCSKYIGWFGFIKYNDLERRLLWAIFYEGWRLGLWLASVVLCVTAFVYFSIWILLGGYPSNASGDPSWVVYPYGSFLLFSAGYVPLLMYVKSYPVLVIITLACVAMSALLLWVWTLTYLDLSVANNLAVCIFSGWLAVHCSVFDLIWWGVSWYRRMYWSEGHKFIKAESKETPSSCAGCATQWPEIKYSSLPKVPLLLRLPE